MATYWENSCSFGLRYVSWYKYLIVSLFFFPTSVFGVGIFLLIAPFPDLCLLVPFYNIWAWRPSCLCDLESDIHFGSLSFRKVQVGRDQEKAHSVKDSNSKNRDGKKLNKQSGTYTIKSQS